MKQNLQGMNFLTGKSSPEILKQRFLDPWATDKTLWLYFSESIFPKMPLLRHTPSGIQSITVVKEPNAYQWPPHNSTSVNQAPVSCLLASQVGLTVLTEFHHLFTELTSSGTQHIRKSIWGLDGYRFKPTSKFGLLLTTVLIAQCSEPCRSPSGNISTVQLFHWPTYFWVATTTSEGRCCWNRDQLM